MTTTELRPPRSLLPNDSELMPCTDPGAAVISIDPERMSGTPCFVGSRVPIQTLWDYIEGGENLEVFLDAFDGVTRQQAVAVLRLALDRLLEGLPKP